jgi:hypothetical protein
MIDKISYIIIKKSGLKYNTYLPGENKYTTYLLTVFNIGPKKITRVLLLIFSSTTRWIRTSQRQTSWAIINRCADIPYNINKLLQEIRHKQDPESKKHGNIQNDTTV